jgi:hypothetical protein
MQARVRAELVEIGASDDDEVRCLSLLPTAQPAVPIGSAPAWLCRAWKTRRGPPDLLRSLDSNEGVLLNAWVHRVEVALPFPVLRGFDLHLFSRFHPFDPGGGSCVATADAGMGPPFSRRS